MGEKVTKICPDCNLIRSLSEKTCTICGYPFYFFTGSNHKEIKEDLESPSSENIDKKEEIVHKFSLD